jgi:uncharacterized membrane protein YedE/YeeE
MNRPMTGGILRRLHANKSAQLIIGLLTGMLFGFLLQKGRVTRYSVIINQLLLTDFTVVKVMLTAVVTGMIGVHVLRSTELAELHPKEGSWASAAIGGLIFGVGFAVLGYCPGTMAGAAGQGSLDALLGGVVGMLIGSGIFAAVYPRLNGTILKRGEFKRLTFPELLNVTPWVVILPTSVTIIALLLLIEKAGL